MSAQRGDREEDDVAGARGLERELLDLLVACAAGGGRHAVGQEPDPRTPTLTLTLTLILTLTLTLTLILTLTLTLTLTLALTCIAVDEDMP